MAGLFDYEDPESVGRMAFAAGLLNAAGPQKMPVSVGQAISMGLLGRQQAASEAGQNRRRNQLAEAQIEDWKAQALQRRALAEAIKQKELHQRQVEQQQQQYLAQLGGYRQGATAMKPETMVQQQFDPIAALKSGFSIDDIHKFVQTQNLGNPKPVAPTDLARLTTEMNALPLGHSQREFYKNAINKLTTHAPPISVNSYGSPVAGTEPGKSPQFYQFPNKPGQAPIATGVSPLPNAASTRKAELSPTMQKKLLEIGESVDEAAITKQVLNDALTINPQAYSGYFAGQRATARSNFPGQDPAADATIQYQNIIDTNALQSLKTLFGGQPTEGERKVLLDLQASVNKQPQQRAEIINRALLLVEERLKRNMKMAEDIKAGKYSARDKPEDATPSREDPLGIRK